MNNSILLTTYLDPDLVDLNSLTTKYATAVSFNNQQYVPSTNITFNVISAGIENNILYNTQQYLDVNELKNCFNYSSNINKTNVEIAVQSPFVNQNGKILLDSLSDITMSVSSYVTINDKEYYLAAVDTLIKSYTVKNEFTVDALKLVLPVNKSVNIDLTAYITNLSSEFPEDIISTYIELPITLSNLQTTNKLSGYINAQLSTYLTTTNNYCVSTNLESKYYNNLLNKSYVINTIPTSCYIVMAQLSNKVKWVNSLNLDEFYLMLTHQTALDTEYVTVYGTKDLNVISLGTPTYFYRYLDNSYISQNTYLNASKIQVNINTLCENTSILDDILTVYVYNLPSYEDNKKFYYIKNSIDSITSSQFIFDLNSYSGTKNTFTIDSQSVSALPANIKKTYLLEFYTESLLDGQKTKIAETNIQTCPVIVNYTSGITKIYPSSTQAIQSNIITESNTELSTSIPDEFEDITFNSTINNNNVIWNTTFSAKELTSLKTSSKDIPINLLYNDNDIQYLLSTLIFPVTFYGNSKVTALSGYNILTNTNNITGNMLVNLKNEYVLDTNAPIYLNLGKEWSLAYKQNNLSWLHFDYQTNIISGELTTVDEYDSLLEDLQNQNYTYFSFKKIGTWQERKYYVYPKALLSFPGEQLFNIKFNTKEYQCTTIDDFNALSLHLNNSNTLTFNNEEIKFTKYLMDLSGGNFEITADKDELSTALLTGCINQISTDYILSSSIFTYNNNININELQSGTYESKILIYPKDITYDFSTINLLPEYSLKVIIR